VGLNKQYINFKSTLNSLSTNGLELYYRNGYVLMFEDLESSMVHDLHIDGKSDKEILTIINDKQITEKKNYEVY
jgi:hypothetical protein